MLQSPETRFVAPSMPAVSMDEDLEASDSFPLLAQVKKRKLPVTDDFRPSKVLVTEVARDLDNLQLRSLDLSGEANAVPHPPVSPSYSKQNVASWVDFQDVEQMDIDVPSGRRVCPQLEMTDSLKLAIRLAEQEDEAILPEGVLSSILRPLPENPCTALVLYSPLPWVMPTSGSTEVHAAMHASSVSDEGSVEAMAIDEVTSDAPQLFSDTQEGLLSAMQNGFHQEFIPRPPFR